MQLSPSLLTQVDKKEQQRIFELTSIELQQELQKGQIAAVDVLQVYLSQVIVSF